MNDPDKYLKSASKFAFTASLQSLCNTLQGAYGRHTVNNSQYLFFNNIFDLMLQLRDEYFFIPEWKYLLTQLLLGVRVSEINTVTYITRQTYIRAKVRTAKGSEDRDILYMRSSPLLETFLKLVSTDVISPSYQSYYRSLLKANPNFYKRFDSGHLTATHIFRHFHVQVVKYVLQVPDEKITKIMGWYNKDTIKNYTDKHIWDKLIGGIDNGRNTKISKRGKKHMGDSPDRNSFSGSSGKNNIKKKKRRIKKER